MDYDFVRLRIEENSIAVLSIENPSKLNALNFHIYDELSSAVDEIERMSDIKALILWGDEKVFGAGADVKDLQSLETVDAGYRRSCRSHRLCDRIEDLPFPTIAAIAGYTFGGCFELALSCDLRIATPKAKFALPEVTLGLLPGSGGTQRLPKIVGIAKAKEMMYFGDVVRADEAYRIGIVNKIVEEGSIYEAAMEMARRLAKGAGIALGLIKAAVNHGYDLERTAAMEMEARAFGELFATKDAGEGMDAFINKRSPEFKGK